MGSFPSTWAREDDMKHTKLAWTIVMAAFAVSMAAAPAAAKGGPKVKAPKPAASAKAKPTSAKPKAPKAQAPKTQAAKAKAPKANANTAKPAKGPKANASEPTLTSAKREQSPFSSANGGTPTDTDPTLPMNKAQQLLLKNDNLRMKVQTRLGSDPIAAASGFRNLGQFVAAVNASYNKGISFAALKALMTGPEPMSLGKAMQQLKGLDPATADTAANAAMAQADADILAAR
jgi:hypothetical protein